MLAEVGAQFVVEADNGKEMLVAVKEITETAVLLDGNDQLAGVTLVFKVKVEGLRTATPEELKEGKPNS